MPDPRIWPVPSANDTFSTVGAVSTLDLAANPNRVDCDFVNDGNEACYLGRGNAAVIGSGHKLVPNGSYHIGTNNLFLGAIYGICANGQLNITISEGIKP